MKQYTVLSILALTVSLAGCGGGGGSTPGAVAQQPAPTPTIQTPHPVSANSAFAGTWAGPFVAGDQQGTTTVTIATDGTAHGTLINTTAGMRGTMQGTVNDGGNALYQVRWQDGSFANVSGAVNLFNGRLVGLCQQQDAFGAIVDVTFSLSRQ